MSQKPIEVGHRDLSAPARPPHRSLSRKKVSKNDLLPFVVLLGAVYGWVVVLLAVTVALILLLVD